VYTPYRELYSCFPYSTWWRFLLVSVIFWIFRVYLGLQQTEAVVNLAGRGNEDTTYTFHNSLGIRMLYGISVFQPHIFRLVCPELLKLWSGYVVGHDKCYYISNP
jgi:hypothetical protein